MAGGLTENLTSTPEGMRLYQQERIILEVTELICQLMHERGVTRAQLADRLRKTKGYVTQLLDGRANMTLRTISDVFFALDRAFHVLDGPLQATVSSCLVLSFAQAASWGEQSGSWPDDLDVRLEHPPGEPPRKMAV